MPSPIARRSGPPAVTRTAIFPVAALIAMLGLAQAAGGPSQQSAPRRVPEVSATQVAFDAVLDAKKPAVVGCVMVHGISLGAQSVRLEIKVLINRQGQVFGLDVQVVQKGGNKNAMTGCVKKALNVLHFPPSRSALTELRREWTFATTQGPGR